ncbi:hypothetical protein ANTPLA_LOCUS993 [Anthophora plagiata]
MWDLGNRGIVALVSALSGCVFFYNAWGPILILTISLFLTIYACYSLIINDSLLSPHAFILFHYCKQLFLEVRTSFEGILDHAYRYTRQFFESANHRFRKRYLTHSRMERRRGSHYQLSTDPYSTKETSTSSYGSITQLSPIGRNVQKVDVTNHLSPQNRFYHDSEHSSYDHGPLAKHTSTPMFPRNKEEFENQPFDVTSLDETLSRRTTPSHRRNHSSTQEGGRTYFGGEGSSWGSCLSSKERTDAKVGERKAVQTVAVPLLATTRYNIDSKVYNDVTSPGLTTRLRKYAAEANSKLTHQSQYRVGQFPRVNLNASPVPLINAKTVKTRMPVTIRVAPPNTIRYSPPSKHKIFTNLHEMDNSCSPPSVAQALREISLKRHASREDVASELAKKQRTDGLVNKELEIQDETKQKRSRDDSLKSEEEISPQSKSVRPTKRTKTPSCYDIINSLSSSRHVVSGVKRKARDFSRSGTPDFEKHFKSLECVQSTSTQTSLQVHNTSLNHRRSNDEEAPGKGSNSDKLEEHLPLKGILKTSNKSVETESNAKRSSTQRSDNDRSIESPGESARLTHKLFMRAEPERNEKLRMLVEEQGNIRAKFTTDDVEEIKKEDIADMRQTSMKARLQSMFDAISGKAASRINPDVVIQAEEANVPTTVPCPVICATLNSSTTTTNVNTTPISTSAVVPSPGTSESETKSPKHVAFNLPNKESCLSNSNVQQIVSGLARTNNESVSTTPATNKTTTGVSVISFAPSTIVSQRSVPNASTQVIASTPTNSNVQTFDAGKSTRTTIVATAASSSGSVTRSMFTLDGVTANKSPLFATVPIPTANIFGNVAATVPTPMTVPTSTVLTNANSETNRSNMPPTNVSQAAGVASPSSNVSFGIFPPSQQTNNATAAVAVAENKERNVGSTSMDSNANSNIFIGITSTGGDSSTTTSTTTSTTMTTFTTTPTTTATSAVCSPTPLLTFGSQTTSNPEAFVFVSAANTSQSNGIFGNSTVGGNAIANTAVPNSSSTNVGANVPISFDSSVKPTLPTFGSSSTSTFTFRVPSTSSTNDGKTGFSFGNTSATTTTSSNTSVFAMGSNTTTTAATPTPTISSNNNSDNNNKTNPTPSFGATPSTSSNAGSIFASSISTPSIFGATSTQSNQLASIFGTPSNLKTVAAPFSVPKSTATGIFGSNVASTSVAFPSTTSSMQIFSNPGGVGTISGIPSTTSVPVFGTTGSTSVSGIAGTSSPATGLFSGASLASPTTTTTTAFGTSSNIFGQANSSAATNFKSGASVFGSNSGSTLFGAQASTSSAFGTANVSSTNNLAPSAFGSTNVSTSNAALPTFGQANTVTSSVFGPQTKTTLGAQCSTSQNFPVGPSIFRTENAGGQKFTASNGAVFGSFAEQIVSPNRTFNTTSTGNVNTNANANANVNASTNVNANANVSSTPFGDGGNKVSLFGPQTSAFGAPNASAPAPAPVPVPASAAAPVPAPATVPTPVPAFGAINTNNENNTSGIFTFGANQKIPQQNTSFTFGGNNPSAASTSGVPFQFGATTLNSGAGFNFAAPTTTPSIKFGTTSATPTFNASTPGMFSIGSGSTAPRSRNMRTRKPR